MLILPSFKMAFCSHLVIFLLRNTRQRWRNGANHAAFYRLWVPPRLPTFGNSQRHLFINSRKDWKGLKLQGRPLQMILRVRTVMHCDLCSVLGATSSSVLGHKDLRWRHCLQVMTWLRRRKRRMLQNALHYFDIYYMLECLAAEV